MFALSLAMAPVPVVQKKPAYAAIWRVEPQKIASDTVTLKPGDTITAARLLPERVVKLEADAVAPDGKVLAEAGTLMMVLRSSISAACTFSFPNRTGLAKIWNSNQKFTCLLDNDRDGKFESSFPLASARIGVPPPFGYIPRKQTAIRPAGFAAQPIGDEDVYPQLLVKYSHRDQITGFGYLGVCIGNATSKSEPCFDGYTGVSDKRVPLIADFHGCKVEVLTKQDAMITVRLLSPFDAQPFTAQEYTRWMFY